MDFHRLEVFIKVYELKSFSRAGEALLLSQPTISEHIRVLEEELGLALFDRQGKEVLPTPAGKLLFHYAIQIKNLGEETYRALKQFRDKGSGELLVGGSNIPGQYLLPPLLGRFKERFPRIQISLLIGDSRFVRDKLLDGIIELGLVGTSMDHRQISCEFWAVDHMVCVAPPGDRSSIPGLLSPEDLLHSPFIFREKGSGTRTAIEQALKKIHLDIRQMRPVAEMGSNEAIRQAVKSGVGISILSRRAVSEDLERGQVREIKIKRFPLRRDFYLITLKQRTLSPLAREFKEFIINRSD
ncbi:MAG: selenium metabolism-associated LysR family transcriptional regulator [Thermodesulfobacteriota bacterium]